MNRFCLLLCLLAPLLSGCGMLGGVSVEHAKTIAKPPADVMIYMSVEDGGEPVAHLESRNFKVYENDVLLSQDDIHLKLLPRDSVADGHTVLLLDLSGDITQKQLSRISRGAAQFVRKVTTTQAVSVVVFDGSEDARLVARFPRVNEQTRRDLPDLTPFVSGDSSRDLHSAILQAIALAEEELARSGKPVKLGTVVTMARGPDLAGRKTETDLYEAIEDSSYEFYLLSPPDVDMNTKGAIGQDSRFEYETWDTVPMVFQDLGMRVRDAWGRHYLVRYCTPARHGQRDVKVVVEYHNDRGDERRGKMRTAFEAKGFDEGCGPMRTVLRQREEELAAERAAQEKAEKLAAEERRKAEERAAKRRRAAAAQERAAAANAAAESSLQESSEADAAEEEVIIAPPEDGEYE